MPAVPPILPRHLVIAEAWREIEIQPRAGIVPEIGISAPPVAVALPYRAAVPVLIARTPVVVLLDMTGGDHDISANTLHLRRGLPRRLLKCGWGLDLWPRIALGPELSLRPGLILNRRLRLLWPGLALELPLRSVLGRSRCWNGGLRLLRSVLALDLSLRPVLSRSRCRNGGLRLLVFRLAMLLTIGPILTFAVRAIVGDGKGRRRAQN
jgi:hypothetical protein